jgi:histidinol-phosphatase
MGSLDPPYGDSDPLGGGFMGGSGVDLEEALSAGLAAVQAAERVVLAHFGRPGLAVQSKGDGSPVSEADQASELAVREVLSSDTPEIPVLGEEYGDDDPEARLRWVVDPIDGTVSFVHGLPLFGTLLALHDVVEDRVLVGVLSLPALRERYAAAWGRGCTRNGAAWTLTPHSGHERTIVGAADPQQFSSAGVLDEYHTLIDNHRYLRGYTDAFGHAMVLGGGLDAMVDPGLKPWDLLATRCLVREAGGLVLRRPSAAGGDVVDAILGRPAPVRGLAALLGWRAGVLAEGVEPL